MNTMLACFHYSNMGTYPFHSVQEDKGCEDLGKLASLEPEQVDFVLMTSQLIKQATRGKQLIKHEFHPSLNIC